MQMHLCAQLASSLPELCVVSRIPSSGVRCSVSSSACCRFADRRLFLDFDIASDGDAALAAALGNHSASYGIMKMGE